MSVCCALLGDQSQVTPPGPLSVPDLQGWSWMQMGPPASFSAHPTLRLPRAVLGTSLLASAVTSAATKGAPRLLKGGSNPCQAGWDLQHKDEVFGNCQMCSSIARQGGSLWRDLELCGCGTGDVGQWQPGQLWGNSWIG